MRLSVVRGYTPRWKDFPGKTGFTLIELLIALSIFAVVAVALYSAFYAGVSMWRRSSEGGDVHQEINYALDDISRDFRNAVHMTDDIESVYAFSGDPDRASFITLQGAMFGEKEAPLRELVKIQYEYDRTDSRLVRRAADMASGFNIDEAEGEEVLAGVEEFKFNYCYASGEEFEPYSWEDEWKSDVSLMPRGVRMVMRVRPAENIGPLEFTKTILIPTGELGEKDVGL